MRVTIPEMPIPGPGVPRAELPRADLAGHRPVFSSLSTRTWIIVILCLLVGVGFRIVQIDDRNAELRERILRLDHQVFLLMRTTMDSRPATRLEADVEWRAAHP